MAIAVGNDFGGPRVPGTLAVVFLFSKCSNGRNSLFSNIRQFFKVSVLIHL